ncbi:MAG: hypothetical protein WCL50_04330 [Spirochaetota bacterium]
MSNSISSKLEASRKFLEKNAKHNLNLKQAQSALSDAEKANMELSSLKARLADLMEARTNSVMVLDEALARVRLEKKLKAKEAKVQEKLAVLASLSGVAK